MPDGGRTATVEYNHLYERRGMPWMLRCHGQGRCTRGEGVPSFYPSEDHAERVGAVWVADGVAPADQRG